MPSAGEVEQFAYCAHNWWLARHGAEGTGEGVARGMRQHREKGQAQEAAEAVRKESGRALRWMFRILMAAASATFLTLEVLYLSDDPRHLLFLATALVMVGASAGLLTIAGLQERDYRHRVIDAGLVPGKVLQEGWTGDHILRDPGWGISGSPDNIMDTAHGPVPVEVKTGGTPPSPYPSHELQLACYLRLIEVATGTRPEYGLLTYPDGVFRVAWDEDLRRRLQETLARMEAAQMAGKADRDHQHAARCAGCARRDACEQALA